MPNMDVYTYNYGVFCPIVLGILLQQKNNDSTYKIYSLLTFKLSKMIPITIKYDLESVATLKSLSECPYVHL